MHRLCVMLGGRVAEEIFFSRITTGALDDLQKARTLAYESIVKYGMNETIGPVNYEAQDDQAPYYKSFSEDTARIIDIEIAKMIQYALRIFLFATKTDDLIREAHTMTVTLLTERREETEKVAKHLNDRGVVTR